MEQTRNKKTILVVAIAMGSLVLLVGAFLFFEIRNCLMDATVAPKKDGLVSYLMAHNEHTWVDRPAVVEELEKPDKTLYDATYFVSINGFNKVNILGKNKYFNYELLTAADYDELDKLTEPTNVNVVCYRDSSYADWAVRFSCFVYKIDYDYIYLGTAGHCIPAEAKRKNVEIRFFNREPIRTSLLDYKMGGGFGSAAGDYAMYRIPVSIVPDETLMQLKEVAFDPENVTKVKIGDVYYSGNIYAKDNTTDYDRKLTVITKEDGIVKEAIDANAGFVAGDIYFATDIGLISGQSGSAVFNQYGSLVGITSGHHNFRGSNYGIFTKADKINELYEQFIEDEINKAS